MEYSDIRELKGLDIVKHIEHPEVSSIWNKERAAAKDGRLKPTPCPHPVSTIEQYEDVAPGREGRPTNLFACGVCHRSLRLVDAFNKEAAEL